MNAVRKVIARMLVPSLSMDNVMSYLMKGAEAGSLSTLLYEQGNKQSKDLTKDLIRVLNQIDIHSPHATVVFYTFPGGKSFYLHIEIPLGGDIGLEQGNSIASVIGDKLSEEFGIPPQTLIYNNQYGAANVMSHIETDVDPRSGDIQTRYQTPNGWRNL